MTKPSPQASDDGRTGAGRPHYRFDDADRIRAAESRKQVYVETALTCDACYAAPTCSAFQRGAVCSLIPTFKDFPSRNAQEVVAKIRDLIAVMEERTWRSYYFELLRGGKPKWRVTKLFEKLIKHHLLLMRLYVELNRTSNRMYL